MDPIFYKAVQDCPIIPAVKNGQALERCLALRLPVVFVLYGSITTLPGIVERLKANGSLVLVHADLIQGLAPQEIAVDYIKAATAADGIISTRMNLVQHAHELGLHTVYRVFAIDSRALNEAMRIKNFRADFLEILPGLMPDVLKRVKRATGFPLLTGGLISAKAEVLAALEAGAMAISTTHEDVWNL